MSFKHLNLIEPLLRALDEEGYTLPTPIQEQAIPVILNRKDLLGCAQTGTGKTAAFALPLLQLLREEKSNAGSAPHAGHASRKNGSPIPTRALILTPTRELAIQIKESFAAYGKHLPLKHLVIFGGVPQQPQVQGLQHGVDILVATPGRLLDLMDQGYVHLEQIQFFVLDEADRMLDMGFVHDVKKVIARLPRKRQTLLFSATMPPEIQQLAASILIDPVKVEVTPPATTAETVGQSIYFVDKQDKRSLLLHLLQDRSIPAALVFTRTKHGADKVAKGLTRAGVRAEAIHGNKSQNARQAALTNFKNRQIRVLVATDIAARGIDIDDLTHVINFELPNVPETYVHRIGRTGRAGASGQAISFCDAEEMEYLRDIQKLITQHIPVVEKHPFVLQGSPINKQLNGSQEPNGQRQPAASRQPGQPNRRESRPLPKRNEPLPDRREARQQPKRNGSQPSGQRQAAAQRPAQPVKPPAPAKPQPDRRETRQPSQPHRRPSPQTESQPARQPVQKPPVTRLADQPAADDQIAMLKLNIRQDSGDERW